MNYWRRLRKFNLNKTFLAFTNYTLILIRNGKLGQEKEEVLEVG